MQIVAPAGNINALHAAIKAGADAVYLGMPLFGARAKAQNFDEEQLKTAIEYAHLCGVKVFVTLNTLIKDRELDRAVEMAGYAHHAGVDAAIVQDIRFIKCLNRRVPHLTLHASTQMGVHNREGALCLLDLGISRGVLSRETLPQDIADIKSTGLEIEFFVQGALCVSFSGNCYFSSLASSYSGNRGKCMQLCRKAYTFHGERGYFLSAKDIFLYDRLAELCSLGVDAIKIEGRMRSEEYVYRAVKTYSSAVTKEQALSELKSAYNRGDYCSAYLDKNAPFCVIYSKCQANIGTFVGKVDCVKGNAVKVRGFSPHPKDGFKLLRAGAEFAGATVINGEITSDKTARNGDEVRRTYCGELADLVRSVPDKRMPINVTVCIKQNVAPEITVSSDACTTVTVGKTLPQSAVTSSLCNADIERAFFKTGDIPFLPEVRSFVDDGMFMPVSALNELRRSAYAQHKAAVLAARLPKCLNGSYVGLDYNKFTGHGVIFVTDSSNKITSDMEDKFDYLAVSPADYSRLTVPNTKKPVMLVLPPIMRGEDREVIAAAIERPEIMGVISNNLYALKLTKKPILLGPGHNIIGKCDLPHVTSFEADEQTGGFVYAFGYAPLMTLCHCPYGKCISCSGRDELIDESGRRFAMRRVKVAHCYWQLLNCVPHKIIDAPERAARYPDRIIDCTGCDNHTALSALSYSYNGQFTRGNINKGLK